MHIVSLCCKYGEKTMGNIHYIGRKLWVKSIAWILLFGFIFSMANYFYPTKLAIIRAFCDTLFLFIVYMVSIKLIFPRYFSNLKKYSIITVLFILTISFLFFLFDTHFLINLKKIEFTAPPLFFKYFRLVTTSSFVCFIGTSVGLIEHNQRLIENEKLLIEEKLETELKLLKAQINPHFIFNALNNIYSLTYMQSKNAPDSVLKLSEMLRYVFYDCNKDKVPLSSEIKYIKNFSAFQQMKSEYKQNITIESGAGVSGVEIAPMLYIPFIENAFKYSRIEEDKEAYVNIAISKDENQVLFSIKNSVPKGDKPLSGSGMGIKNVQHRLAIIYPNRHELSFDEKEDCYAIKLSIEI